MTQAFNLSQFANKLNTSGQTDNTGLQNSSVTVTAGTGLTGGGSVALGSSVTISDANSGVTAGSYTTANITVNALGKITSASNGSVSAVTSASAGNGIAVSGATGAVTFSLGAPAANSVGSYAFFYANYNSGGTGYGSSVSIGGGGNQVQLLFLGGEGSSYGCNFGRTTSGVSGTWRWMSNSPGSVGNPQGCGIAVRIA